MHTASINELKKELKNRSSSELINTIQRLARYKKENKELLHYLLFESENETFYIDQVKNDITEAFETINTTSFYLAKKTIRKVLRLANKQIRYSGIKQTEIEILIFYCQSLLALDLPIKKSKVLMNLLNNQLKKIDKALMSLHEDLQYDYRLDLDALKGRIESL